jgi:hypothetical protein
MRQLTQLCAGQAASLQQYKVKELLQQHINVQYVDVNVIVLPCYRGGDVPMGMTAR